MKQNIDLYEYINKWVGNSTIYPYYKIDLKLDLISKLISAHKSFNNISILASGAKRNRTDINYMEYLNVYIMLNDTDGVTDTRKFKLSILDLIKKNDNYQTKINEISYYLILEYENEKIMLLPSFKNVDENNIEGAMITNSNGTNEIFYPKLDNKNFDKKEQECGTNFINLIKIFKYIFLTFSSEIKSMNELSPNIIEALVWNLPNEYFNFNDYDEAILKAIDYIYEKIASDDYMSLSEINDIKVLFSIKNNLHRKEILKALYKIKQIIHESM
ncbi:hypothetical protein [Brachyspira innocens]|uniref:hypothetical protein n=1 Tax=Brachyspira innocens TaxID=13264 RepID=UPI0003764BF5|nr:hypothetical protein [Brachyspira innocens]